MLPDFKTPLLWVLGLALVAALALVGIERTQVLMARADTATAKKALSDEKLDRQKENTARALAALAETQRLVKLVATHSQTQQEASSALAAKTLELQVADSRYAALDQRVRNTAAALATALDRADAERRAAAGQHQGDRPESVAVVADGIRLLGEAGPVVRACRRDLARRDAEVEALSRSLANDRGLLDGAAAVSLLPAGETAKLPTAFPPQQP